MAGEEGSVAFPAMQGVHIQVYTPYCLSLAAGSTQTARMEVGMLSLAYIPYINGMSSLREEYPCPSASQMSIKPAGPLRCQRSLCSCPRGLPHPPCLATQQPAKHHVPITPVSPYPKKGISAHALSSGPGKLWVGWRFEEMRLQQLQERKAKANPPNAAQLPFFP